MSEEYLNDPADLIFVKADNIGNQKVFAALMSGCEVQYINLCKDAKPPDG